MEQEMRIQSKIIISKFTGNYIQENAQDFICVLKKKITTHETWEDEVKRRSLSV